MLCTGSFLFSESFRAGSGAVSSGASVIVRTTPRYYDASLASGTEVAAALGQSAECVFKTLVAEANTGEHFVFVIPAPETLSLKKAAKAAGVKSIAMLPQKKLLPLTGYVHGGCSPVGMKKPFPTWIDETALLTDAFFCSAGRLGAQIGIDPEALAGYIGAQFADLTEE